MKHQQNMYLYVESDSDAKSGMRFILVPKRFRYYMNDNAIEVAELPIKCSLPKDLTEETLRGQAIATLINKQERAIAEAYQRKQELQEKINNLKLLTYTEYVVPEPNPDDDTPF